MAILFAVPLGLTLKTGAFNFFIDHPIKASEQPVRYWSIVSLLAVVVAAFVFIGWRQNLSGHVFMTPG